MEFYKNAFKNSKNDLYFKKCRNICGTNFSQYVKGKIYDFIHET